MKETKDERFSKEMKEITQKMAEINIGNKSIQSEEEIINLLDLLFVNPEQNQSYINNIFAEKVVGLPFGQKLPFNIKLTSNSLYDLVKYLSKK